MQTIRGLKVLQIRWRQSAFGSGQPDYLNHRISLHELVAWAEQAMMEGDFVGKDWKAARDVVARIGVADVRAFGLTWEDCEKSLTGLGYRAKVEVSQVVA